MKKKEVRLNREKEGKIEGKEGKEREKKKD